MKQKLLVRLEEMNKTIDEKIAQLNQLNADVNVLRGHRGELVNVINMCNEAEPEPEPEPAPVTPLGNHECELENHDSCKEQEDAA